ncbi:MAG TPA: hypothetical protein VHW23_07965 [Kofleriaceae bacterium]|jgi:hypothetical protein|nr:hypothetical protein [Kofleriaceae bacterium]
MTRGTAVGDAHRDNRHAWLQKHPSPQTATGEFHWYPTGQTPGDRELRAGLVERVRGIEPPAVLWQLERGRVAWGQVFAATAPLDGRRYVGLVLSVVEGDRPACDLLAALAPPPAGPWSDGLATASPGREPAVQELTALRREARGDAAAVARALLSGGTARVDDPESPGLPAWIASIDRILPEPGSRARCGVWCAAPGGPGVSGTASGPGAGGATAQGAHDRVAALAAAAWREPASRQARAWTLLCELATARGESIDAVGAALAVIDPAAALTAEERALAPGGVVDVLHAWGRGRLDRSPAADTLAARLADLVALRVLNRLAAGEEPGAAIAEARWYALVPAARRTQLMAAVARRTTSLRTVVEAHHA